VAVIWEAGAGAGGGAGVLAVTEAGVEGVWADTLAKGLDDAAFGCVGMISQGR
jgi:hypothetical protein